MQILSFFFATFCRVLLPAHRGRKLNTCTCGNPDNWYGKQPTHNYDKNFKPIDIQSINVTNLFWLNASIHDNDFSIQLITNEEPENKMFLGDGSSLVLTFRVFDQESTFSAMPRLQHNDQSSQLDVEFKNFSSFGYNITRYGLEMSIVSSAQRLDGVFIDERITMNDEPTPGVFELRELVQTHDQYLPPHIAPFQTDVLIDRKDNAFILWKSACYDQPERGLTSLMGVRHDDLVLPHSPSLLDLGSLALGYYGRYLNGRQVRSFNLTFGANSDRSCLFHAYMWNYVSSYIVPYSSTLLELFSPVPQFFRDKFSPFGAFLFSYFVLPAIIARASNIMADGRPGANRRSATTLRQVGADFGDFQASFLTVFRYISLIIAVFRGFIDQIITMNYVVPFFTPQVRTTTFVNLILTNLLYKWQLINYRRFFLLVNFLFTWLMFVFWGFAYEFLGISKGVMSYPTSFAIWATVTSAVATFVLQVNIGSVEYKHQSHTLDDKSKFNLFGLSGLLLTICFGETPKQ
uniref:Uncharacterized protein n=1 Tax=Romanomermis culicivorax TaxID=13658 RepID=A0A915K0N6_ROMCU